MPKPLIGITTRLKSADRSGEDRFDISLNDEYSQAVIRAGGAPLLIPVDYPLDTLPHLLNSLQGVLLSGGGDIDPIVYGIEGDTFSKSISPQRDQLELALVKLANEMDLPLLGICRGQQMLNIATGGTLYTDIGHQCNTDINHQRSKPYERNHVVHNVEIVNSSRLSEIIGSGTLGVNSRHHQAIREVAPEFIVTAQAKDGLIEGIEHPSKRFCVGVQWHPESLPEMAEHHAIFEAFICAASD